MEIDPSSSTGKKRKTSSIAATTNELLPPLPPFTGKLEFIPTQPRHRKCDTLILLPDDDRDDLNLHRPNWTSGCSLSRLYGKENVGSSDSTEAQSTQAAMRVVGLERRAMEPEKERRVAVVVAAEDLVQRVMGEWDSSHDPFHALRVRDLALSLASEEGLPLSSFLTVELAALLHDIDDHKYAARGEKAGSTVESFLKQHNVESNTAEAVLKIVTTMGFKEELGGFGNGPISPEFSVVQDADRLDAIGAIGIARAFTYGGSRNRKMHDPAQAPRANLTKSDYASGDAHPTTINHFAEKLLKLKDLMKSQAGKKRAMQRHECMVSFLHQFHGEWEGKY